MRNDYEDYSLLTEEEFDNLIDVEDGKELIV